MFTMQEKERALFKEVNIVNKKCSYCSAPVKHMQTPHQLFMLFLLPSHQLLAKDVVLVAASLKERDILEVTHQNQ